MDEGQQEDHRMVGAKEPDYGGSILATCISPPREIKRAFELRL